MDVIEEYIQEVMRDIHAPQAERGRIESDLRAHLAEAIQAGQAPREAVVTWVLLVEALSGDSITLVQV